MHRFVHRLFGGEFPPFAFTMDGAEMGKLMVAEGLGVTLLPDYSVHGDPLERLGAATTRPLATQDNEVLLHHLQRRPAPNTTRAIRALHDAIVHRARRFSQEAVVQTASPLPGTG